MILRIEDIKDACSKILSAVDSNSIASVTETLELRLKDKYLFISVTNREYYARVKIFTGCDEEFLATVNANIFLRLVAQTTSETLELSIKDNSLLITGNGDYKLPLIYEGDKLLELPVIDIKNITSTFVINSAFLKSLITYNSKEINKGVIAKPVQRMYYLDEQGCITFTTGACVNNFTLSNPIKILLNDRLVKLFKLFNGDSVNFSLGYDAISEEIIQTKVRFEDDVICLTAILSCDDSLLSSVPVFAIRKRATDTYPYSIVVNKNEFLECIGRLLLFNDSKSALFYGKFEFNEDFFVISDMNQINKEKIDYENSLNNLQEPYTATLDLLDLKSTLESCSEEYINFHFGDNQAMVINRNNVYNIIPECRVV